MHPDHAIHALRGAPGARQPVVIKNLTLTDACPGAESNRKTMPDK